MPGSLTYSSLRLRSLLWFASRKGLDVSSILFNAKLTEQVLTNDEHEIELAGVVNIYQQLNEQLDANWPIVFITAPLINGHLFTELMQNCATIPSACN